MKQKSEIMQITGFNMVSKCERNFKWKKIPLLFLFLLKMFEHIYFIFLLPLFTKKRKEKKYFHCLMSVSVSVSVKKQKIKIWIKEVNNQKINFFLFIQLSFSILNRRFEIISFALFCMCVCMYESLYLTINLIKD